MTISAFVGEGALPASADAFTLPLPAGTWMWSLPKRARFAGTAATGVSVHVIIPSLPASCTFRRCGRLLYALCARLPVVAFRHPVYTLSPPASAALRGYRRTRRAGLDLRDAADVARRRQREKTNVWP